MTRAEVIKLLGAAAIAYPRTDRDDTTKAMTVELWLRMLGDLPYAVAEAALMRHISLSQWPPTIADLRSGAAALEPGAPLDGETAWGEVLKAMRQVGYARTPQWSSPLIATAMDRLWGGWSNACQSVQSDDLPTWHAQWLKLWQTLTKRDEERRLLPPQVRELADTLAAKYRLPERAGV